MRVLISSDDTGLGQSIRAALAALGQFSVEQVATADALVALHREGAAALVLIDARGDGAADRTTVVAALRSTVPAAGGTAVVAAVSPGQPPPLGLLDAGADDFVVVPSDVPLLAVRLQLALRGAAGTQAVRALSQNEARFRALVQRSGDVTAVVSADGRVIYASPTVERVTGKSVAALLGRCGADMVHPDDVTALRRHLAEGQTGPTTLRLRQEGGAWLHLEAVISNLLDDPNVQGIVVTARDVTGREQAEAALRASEENLSATLRSIGEAVVATDATGHVVRMNPVAERLTGWSLDEARGRPLSEVAPLGAPGEEGEQQLLDQALRGGSATGGTATLRDRAGGTRPVSATASPIRDAQGVSGVVLVLRDVSDEQRSAEALRRSEQSFRSLIERAPEGITVQRRGRLIYANPAAVRMLGYPGMTQLVGMSCIELVHVDDRDVVRALNEEAVKSGQPSPAREQRYLRADGGLVVAETIALPVDFDGAPALVHIARDITGRKQLEARLLVTDRMVSVGTLAAGVAHEINNPLAGVIANLRFMSEELSELAGRLPEDRGAELVDALHDAQESAERVRVIVRDLKAFSRGDEERRGPVDVARVIESTVHLAWNEIRHRARLVKDVREVPQVLAHEARLGQVLLNLVVNAAHAIVEGDAERNVIRVAARRGEADRVLIEVSDTGAGIPEENLKRLFDPFFTTKPVGLGTGLGLFVCHGIITQLGGEITIESEVGRGTTVRVWLPGLPAAKRPAPSSASPGPGRRGRVLVVDDEPMMLVSVRRLLSLEHEVVTVSSAQEALALLRDGERFDVVLCDLMMPDMTGMDLHAEVKVEQPDLARRIIFLTGGAFTPRARAFLDEVENPRLDKPFEADALRGLVRQQMAPPAKGA